MDSPTISISTSSTPGKGKGDKGKATSKDAEAFSVSLEVARGEADGDQPTTTVTIRGVTAEGDAPDGGAPDGGADGEVTIELKPVVFSGDDLAQNLSASTVLGDGKIAATGDGSFGVSGSISGDSEVRLEVGETLTFKLPPTEGQVVGGQVTITNLFSDGERREGALIFAYDSDDVQLASYVAIGNETGRVTVDIDVPFARLDFKALDNDSFLFEDNSNFGVSDISAVLASVVNGLADGASQVLDTVATTVKNLQPALVDLGHFGTVHFEISRISVDQMATINGLTRARVDLDAPSEQRYQVGLERDVLRRQDHLSHTNFSQADGDLAGS